MGEKKTGLELLRDPFEDHQISQLPKPTISNDQWKKLPKGKCNVCGGFHATTKTIHLSYVGHAALTDRLLDCDSKYSWEPFATDELGLPRFDSTGGLWIRLTVCGVTRPGYGHAKTNTYADIGSREKEVIGDALRNAAMRFGAALDLWHKGDLHLDPPEDDSQHKENTENWIIKVKEASGGDVEEFLDWWNKYGEIVKTECGTNDAKEVHAVYNSIQKGMKK